MTHTDWTLNLWCVFCLRPAVLIRSFQFLLLTKKIIPGGEEIEEEVEVQKRSLSIKCKTTGHDLRKSHFLKMKPRLDPCNKCATLKRSGFNYTNPSVWFGHQRGSLQHETTKEPICEATFCWLKLVFFLTVYLGWNRVLELNTLPQRQQKVDKYNLKTHKNTCQRKQERGEGGWRRSVGSIWVQATNQEVTNCTEVFKLYFTCSL